MPWTVSRVLLSAFDMVGVALDAGRPDLHKGNPRY